jgi:parvulin-like peptidyl-prolyl isomerase
MDTMSNKPNEESSETLEQKDTPKDPNQNLEKWKYFLLGIATLIVIVGIFGVVLSVRSVKNLSQDPFVLKVAEVLNLSVAKVNGQSILYTQYIEDLKTLENFYDNAPAGAMPDFTDDEISDQVLSRLIINSIIEEMAKKFDVNVGEEDVNEFKDRFFEVYGGEEAAEEELQEQYGWDMAKYTEKIIRPLVLEQKVSEAFSEGNFVANTQEYEGGTEVKASHILFRTTDNEGNELDKEDVKIQAQEVLERAKSGEDFATLAGEFGSDSTKDKGGDLGWFGEGVMVPEFESAVFALEPGQVGEELAETQFGFHIVMLEDKRPMRNFSKFFNDQLMDADIEFTVNVHDPFEDIKKAQEENQEVGEIQGVDVNVEQEGEETQE